MQQLTKHRTLLIAIALFVVALAIRVINLDQFLTTDEPEGWLGKSMRFSQAILEGRLADTLQHYSPGVTLMWSGSVGLYLEYLLTPNPAASFHEFLQMMPFDPVEIPTIFWFRLPNILIGAACMAICYPLAQKLLGSTVAVVGLLLLALDPLFIGMNRVLGHDGLATSFMMVSALAAILFFSQREEQSLWLLALSAIFAGLATSAKSTALFIVPFVGFTAIITAWIDLPSPPSNSPQRGENLSTSPPLGGNEGGHSPAPKIVIKKLISHLLLWSLIAAITFVAVWPALWVAPVQTLRQMAEGLAQAADEPHNRGSFFWGQPIPDPGFAFYWVAAYFRMTTVTTIGLLVAVIYWIVTRWSPFGNKNEKSPLPNPFPGGEETQASLPMGGIEGGDSSKRDSSLSLATFLLLAFILFYLIFLSFGSKKQDRYIVPILPMASLAAAVGYFWLIEKLRSKPWQNAALVLIVGLQAAIAFSTAPYYLNHYNLLAGGNRTAPNTLLIGWGEGLDQAADYLNTLPNVENLRVASWYHSAFEPYFAGQAVESAGDEKLSRSAKPALAADYAVLYINQIQRQMPTPGFIQFYQSTKPKQTITIDGIDYAFIYPSPAMQHAFSGEVRLVGQGELLGYSLLDKQGQPTDQIAADTAVTIQLYWAWQGKSQDDPIGLNLVDINGGEWGRGTPLGSISPIPVDQWAEGAIVHDDFALELLPGIPPGSYYLKAWIDRPATGERVGDFPLLLEETQISITRPTTPWSLSDLALTTQLNLPVVNNITLLGLVLPNSPNSINSLNLPNWSPGERRDLTFFWQADRQIDENHPITLALVDSADTTRAEWSGLPAAGIFPTDQWQSGDIIRDPWLLTLPPYVPPGNYRLTAQLGNASPVELLAVTIEGRPRLFDAPPLDIALNGQFGESIQLLGLQSETVNESSLEIAPGQPLHLNLVWQADDFIDTDYTTTVQLLDSQQQVHAQRDEMPMNGNAPTTSWASGEVVVDDITLDIPAEVGPGPHHLLIALYTPNSGQRLLLPNGQDHLTIPVDLVNNN